MKKLDAAILAEKEASLRLDYERKEARLKAANKELKAYADSLARTLEEREAKIEILLGLDDVAKQREWERPKSIDKGQATLVCLWSDWHIEQVVRKQETNGLNEWGPSFARRAAAQLVDRIIKIHLPRYRLAASIDSLVVWLGGDFIEGHLRDEQKAYNAMSPVRASKFAYQLLRDALTELAARSNVKDVLVVTSTGNHGRTTEKMWASGRNDTSYETLIYDRLREKFYKHRKIRWHAEEGELSYINIYDHKCRFAHGDSIKYRGGRDGLSGPAVIQIAKWDTEIKADYTFFGDKHTFLWNPPGCFVANGAMCGAAPYSLKYGKNEACQAVAVIDRNRGMTDSSKVFVR